MSCSKALRTCSETSVNYVTKNGLLEFKNEEIIGENTVNET